MALSKRQVLAATMLAIIAITAIAYAQLVTGTITVTTKDRVTVSNIDIGTVPARAAGNKTAEEAITVDLSGLTGKALIGVELVADDLKIYEGFKAFVVQIKNATDPSKPVVTVLTLSNPYAEFEVWCGASHKFDVTVIYAAGSMPVTSVTVHLGATIKAIY
jgi:hypothetical protein